MGRAGVRGFTLIELTVVVIIIGVFAAMAMPQVTRQLRDRRTHETAQRVAMVYQQARMRAMGQGGAILVRFTEGFHLQGTFETQEALVGKVDTLQSCANVPAVSCTQTSWDNPALGQFRSIETLEIGKEPGLNNEVSSAPHVFASLTTETGAPGAAMDICFTPLGRTFVRYGATQPWATPAGVPQISVVRKIGGATPEGITRKVLVLPTGIARLQL